MNRTIVTEASTAVNEAPRFPTCPICGADAVEVFTLFIRLETACRVCGWQARIDDNEGTRRIWHRLLVQGVTRLQTVYGIATAPQFTQGWFAADNPQLGWDIVADWLGQAAVQRLTLPPTLSNQEWQTRRAAAEAGEVTILRFWLWDAFAPLITAAELAVA